VVKIFDHGFILVVPTYLHFRLNCSGALDLEAVFGNNELELSHTVFCVCPKFTGFVQLERQLH